MRQAAEAVGGPGWRYLVGLVRTSVRVGSLAQGAEVARRAVAAAAPDADAHLSIDLRPHRVVLTLQAHATASVTPRDVALAHEISAALRELGVRTDPEVAGDGLRAVQALEIAIDAQDIPAIRPFWRAVLGYADEPGASGPEDPLADPVGQGPGIWFQQMDAPRPQRNRIHVDITVPDDEADRRLRAALAAGGTLVTDAGAPQFWVLADPEGNEACLTTWQGRDG